MSEPTNNAPENTTETPEIRTVEAPRLPSAGIVQQSRPDVPVARIDALQGVVDFFAEKPKPKPKPVKKKAKSRQGLRHGLSAGVLPRDAKYIEIRLNGFRRQLEDALIDNKGEVSMTDAAQIQTAMRWERHAQLAQRWLTKSYDEMPPDQKLHFSREIAKASAHRDKALQALNLDRDLVQDAWLVIDGVAR